MSQGRRKPLHFSSSAAGVHQQLAAWLSTIQVVTSFLLAGALGGRLDHTLVSLSTLHSYRDLNLILMGEGNLARLVPAGRSLIQPLRSVEGPTCGLVPTAGRAITSTRWVQMQGWLVCSQHRLGWLGWVRAEHAVACGAAQGCPTAAMHLPPQPSNQLRNMPCHVLCVLCLLLCRGLRYDMHAPQPSLHLLCMPAAVPAAQGPAVRHGSHGDAVRRPGQQQQCD